MNSQPPSATLRGPQAVDLLIHCRWLFTASPDDSAEQALKADHSIAVADGRIVAILPRAEAASSFTAQRTVVLDQHLVTPGLVNAHGHAAMTLLRGFADDMPLQQWLQEKIWPAENRWVSENFVREGTELAVAEMLRGGTTLFSDMYFFPDQVARSASQAGMRVQVAPPVLEVPTVWGRDAQEYIRKATEVKDQFRNDPLVSMAFGPHAPYTVSDSSLSKVGELANELNVPIHIHLHENAAEVEAATAEHGQRPLERLHSLGLLSPQLQTAHMTQLTAAEIDLVATNGVHVVHCPSSNMKLGSGICPVPALLAAGVNVCLGTDGAASNNALDLLADMQLAALLAKGASGNAAALPADQALRMATYQGALALGLEDQCGSLERGKAADISAFRLDALNTLPVHSPVSSFVYSSRATQCSHVWVAGEACLVNGELQTLDTDRLTAQAQAWCERIGSTS